MFLVIFYIYDFNIKNIGESISFYTILLCQKCIMFLYFVFEFLKVTNMRLTKINIQKCTSNNILIYYFYFLVFGVYFYTNHSSDNFFIYTFDILMLGIIYYLQERNKK